MMTMLSRREHEARLAEAVEKFEECHDNPRFWEPWEIECHDKLVERINREDGYDN